MASKRKELQKAKNNPKGWRFEQLARLYEKFGFEVRAPRGGGSHYHAIHPLIERRPTLVNHPGEIPSFYVKEAIIAIEELLEIQGDDNE